MIMKKLLTMGFVLLFLSTTAQMFRNDFEQFSSLPSHLGQWFLVNGLLNPSSGDQVLANPDYYHVQGSVEANLPETAMGLVSPKSGSAIVGVHIADNTEDPKQEYLSFALGQNLVVGKSYHLQFFWTNGKKTAIAPSGLSVSQMGVLFTDEMPIQMGGDAIQQIPQFTFENSMYSQEWREANITFVAAESSQFVTIGLFGSSDIKSLLRSNAPNAQLAYYYFDDVQLWEINEDHVMRVPWLSDGMPIAIDNVIEGKEVVYVPNSFTPNDDGKNDVFMQLEEEVLGWNLELFNRWGEVIFKSHHATAGWDGKYQGATLEEDIYYWKLNYLNPQGEAKKCSGNVFLIR